MQIRLSFSPDQRIFPMNVEPWRQCKTCQELAQFANLVHLILIPLRLFQAVQIKPSCRAWEDLVS